MTGLSVETEVTDGICKIFLFDFQRVWHQVRSLSIWRRMATQYLEKYLRSNGQPVLRSKPDVNENRLGLAVGLMKWKFCGDTHRHCCVTNCCNHRTPRPIDEVKYARHSDVSRQWLRSVPEHTGAVTRTVVWNAENCRSSPFRRKECSTECDDWGGIRICTPTKLRLSAETLRHEGQVVLGLMRFGVLTAVNMPWCGAERWLC